MQSCQLEDFWYDGLGTDTLGIHSTVVFNDTLLQVNLDSVFDPHAITVDNIPGLVAHYPLDNSAFEAVSQSNGTLTGTSAALNRKGIAQKALYLDGIDDHLDLVPNNIFNPQYSFSLWVKADALPDLNKARFILGLGGEDGDQSIMLANNYSQRTGFAASSYSGQCQGSLSNVIASTGSFTTSDTAAWHHLVVTRSTDTLKLYVDGALIDTKVRDTNCSIPVLYNSTTVAVLGQRLASGSNYNTSSNRFKGILDDFRMYNRAINSTEIQLLYSE
ncbi:MAG: LamG domain-containing protein [Cytophagales bacterium]|nr:LamG domain-containing protein [Cytophagales bacterium]